MDRLINVLRGRIEEWEKKFHLAVDEFVGLWRAQMKGNARQCTVMHAAH